MTDRRTIRVFVEMFREEWRLHSTLFRGSHFALFPVVIGCLTAGTAWLLVFTGTDPQTVFAGLHALTFVFGLHTGSIGFVGNDVLRNLLGDVTLLVFSARTLPLSRDRLLGIFVVKDVLYYSLLFLLPMSVGPVLAVFAAGGTGGVAQAAGTALLLWTTLALTFVLGMGATITSLGLSRNGVPGLVLLAGVGASIGVIVVSDVQLAALTPYGLFLAQTLPRLAATGAFILGVFLVGAVTFEPTGRQAARTVGPAFRRWWRRIDDPLATKTLLDVHRSSGGFGKVLFSAAVLLGVTAGLVTLAAEITGVSPSVGISYGTILGLSGFTTYNWLTQSDDVDAYLVYPVDVAAIFEAKLRAFLLLGPLVGLGFYGGALAWQGGAVFEAIVGAILLVGVACYIFGTTVYLTGLSPNEFLFNSGLFLVFGVALIVPLVPILVVGFALAPVSAGLLAVLGTGGVGLGLTGLALYRRSLPKWARRYRQT
jgi:hypothetical protein